MRHGDSDDELLRVLGSAANEVVDATLLPPRQMAAALERVAQRYARALHITLRDVQAALQTALKGDGDPVGDDDPVRPERAAEAPLRHGIA